MGSFFTISHVVRALDGWAESVTATTVLDYLSK